MQRPMSMLNIAMILKTITEAQMLYLVGVLNVSGSSNALSCGVSSQ